MIYKGLKISKASKLIGLFKNTNYFAVLIPFDLHFLFNAVMTSRFQYGRNLSRAFISSSTFSNRLIRSSWLECTIPVNLVDLRDPTFSRAYRISRRYVEVLMFRAHLLATYKNSFVAFISFLISVRVSVR